MTATTAPASADGVDRPAIWSLVGVDVLARISYQICRTPVLPLYVASLGASPQVVGLTGAASTVTGIVLKTPAGAMSDAVGGRGRGRRGHSERSLRATRTTIRFE